MYTSSSGIARLWSQGGHLGYRGRKSCRRVHGRNPSGGLRAKKPDIYKQYICRCQMLFYIRRFLPESVLHLPFASLPPPQKKKTSDLRESRDRTRPGAGWARTHPWLRYCVGLQLHSLFYNCSSRCHRANSTNCTQLLHIKSALVNCKSYFPSAETDN